MKKFIVTNFRLLFTFLIKLISLLSIICFFSIANAKVISSIKPIAFITEAIASGVTDTDVLLPDSASPHTYSLKPSDLAKIKSADLVIWIGEDMEVFMPTVLKNIDAQKQMELMDIPEVKALLQADEEHKHGDEVDDDNHEHDHHHGEYDQHIWLSPQIAKIIAQAIHDKLIIKYQDKKALIDENLNEFILKLAETEQNIAKKLINVQNKRYFVFHDAYGYFESQFGLKHLGSFTMQSGRPNVTKSDRRDFIADNEEVDFTINTSSHFEYESTTRKNNLPRNGPAKSICKRDHDFCVVSQKCISAFGGSCLVC